VALSQLFAQGGEGQLSLLESPGQTLETASATGSSPELIDEVREKFGPDALRPGGLQQR